MTLEQFIKDKQPQGKIFIGSASNFFLIGDLAEYEKSIEKIGQYYLESAQRSLERNKRELASREQNPPTMSDDLCKLAEVMKHRPTNHMSEYIAKSEVYIAKIKQWQKAIYNNKEAIARNKRYIAHFKPFPQRAVKNFYPSLDNENDTIIIIEGSEIGKYWLENEYKTGKVEVSSDE